MSDAVSLLSSEIEEMHKTADCKNRNNNTRNKEGEEERFHSVNIAEYQRKETDEH
jgi:hypothetical protein